MPVIVRLKTKKYSWKIGKVKLSKVANIEKKLPSSYITKDGFNVTKKFRTYIEPLILGEAYLPFKNGLPINANLKNKLVKKRLKIFRYDFSPEELLSFHLKVLQNRPHWLVSD